MRGTVFETKLTGLGQGVMEQWSNGVRRRSLIALLVVFATALWVNPSPCETFKDSLGREISVPAPPKRLIAIAPNLTEILYALGLGARAVGVTHHWNYH